MRLFCLSYKIAKNNNSFYRWKLQLDVTFPSVFCQCQYSLSDKHIVFLLFFFRSVHVCYITWIILSSWYVRSRLLFIIRSIVLLLIRDLSLVSFRDHFPLHALGHMYVRLLFGMRNRFTIRVID